MNTHYTELGNHNHYLKTIIHAVILSHPAPSNYNLINAT